MIIYNEPACKDMDCCDCMPEKPLEMDHALNAALTNMIYNNRRCIAASLPVTDKPEHYHGRFHKENKDCLFFNHEWKTILPVLALAGLSYDKEDTTC